MFRGTVHYRRRKSGISRFQAPLEPEQSGRTQLLRAAVMVVRNGRCRFQLNVTTCVDD